MERHEYVYMHTVYCTVLSAAHSERSIERVATHEVVFVVEILTQPHCAACALGFTLRREVPVLEVTALPASPRGETHYLCNVSSCDEMECDVT